MHADRVELSWDADKSKWVVRIVAGEEVIRRYCSLPRDEPEAALRSAALATVKEEGFDANLESMRMILNK